MTLAEPGSSDHAHFDVPASHRPRSIAIIMDGNGRWAIDQGLDRNAGHRAGAEAARKVVEECGALGIDTLVLYSFSTENWNRPADEVDALMELLLDYLPRERDELITNNVRFKVIGSRAGLDSGVLAEVDKTTEATAGCTGLQLVLAINYGSRQELTEAMRAIAESVQQGEIEPGEITEETISSNLWTSGLPDPDLLIRTAGEQRLSNYLLWQISYAELHVAQCYWPEFNQQHLWDAIRDYSKRNRRFGALDETNS